MKKKDKSKYLAMTDISIEGNVATWNLNAIGLVNGTYLGTFKFKCFLTPSERLAAGRLYRELLGPNAALASIVEDNLSFTLSQLRFRIIEAPNFWTNAVGLNGLMGDLPDQNVVDMVLEAAVNAELKYVAQLEEKKEEAIKKAKKTAEALLNEKDKKGPLEDEDDED